MVFQAEIPILKYANFLNSCLSQRKIRITSKTYNITYNTYFYAESNFKTIIDLKNHL